MKVWIVTVNAHFLAVFASKELVRDSAGMAGYQCTLHSDTRMEFQNGMQRLIAVEHKVSEDVEFI